MMKRLPSKIFTVYANPFPIFSLNTEYSFPLSYIMDRFVESEELLGGVFFLCDNEATSAVIGVVLPIDAGFEAYWGV